MVMCILLVGASSARDTRRPSPPDSPFYDVFYLYYGESPARARRMLENLFSDKRMRWRARVNLGYMEERESRLRSARKLYADGLSGGDYIAVSYLLPLLRRQDKSGAAELLLSLDRGGGECWILYETALIHAEQNGFENAMDYLAKAVERGFGSPELLDKEPALAPMRGFQRFRDIRLRAAANGKSRPSLREYLARTERSLDAGMPYGLGEPLRAVAELERKGEYAAAGARLTSLIAGPLPFREKSVAHYWAARVNARGGDMKAARAHLDRFLAHLLSAENDPTGYKKLISPIYRDIILNDPWLRRCMP